MQQTNLLRKELKSKDVDYETDDNEFMFLTSWQFEDGLFATFVEYYDGTTEFLMDCRFFTYEKALEVTLG